MALAWVLPRECSRGSWLVLPAPEQIEANLKAVDVVLSQETLDRIETILA